jgi:hypothetical protein
MRYLRIVGQSRCAFSAQFWLQESYLTRKQPVFAALLALSVGKIVTSYALI